MNKTEICNLALGHLGVSKEIQNFDQEKSEEAAACRRFYEISRKTTLSDAQWSFATKFIGLDLVETLSGQEWAFKYKYPSDCLFIRRVLGSHNIGGRIPFIIVNDPAGKMIYCNVEKAQIEYGLDVKDSTFFSPGFALALSFRLALYIVARVSSGDNFGIKKDMSAQYRIELGKAIANSNNEVPKNISARNYNPVIGAR